MKTNKKTKIKIKQKKSHKKGIGEIRVITKLPNSEQSYKGKVKTHKYTNRQNQSTTEKKGKQIMLHEWHPSCYL